MNRETLPKPPYTITEKTADYLAKIVETVTRLEFGTEFKRDIRLHRENRLRTIHSSLAIEGNTLTLGEVTAVIEGKAVAGKQAEIKEVKNAYEAYDKIGSSGFFGDGLTRKPVSCPSYQSQFCLMQ